MRGFAKLSAIAALAAGLLASPALAEAPPPAKPLMTPAPQAGVRIVLPSGTVIILPIEHDAPMKPGENRDHVVGEELC